MRAPRLTDGVSFTSLELTPLEGFISSRFDGVATIEDVVDSTGASLERVEDVARRLEAAGVLIWVDRRPPTRPRSVAPPAASEAPASEAPASGASARPGQHPTRRPKPDSREHRVGAAERVDVSATATQQASRPRRPSSTGFVRTRPAPPGVPRQLYDPVELEEADVDLDPDRRREILDAFYRLDDLDHYQLLGVAPDADKAQIRQAYFRLSKLFHPDTLFGKRLGAFKPKMEAVFRRTTEAYEVLGKTKKRERYDEYLRAKAFSDSVNAGIVAGDVLVNDANVEARLVAEEAAFESARVPSSDGRPKPLESQISGAATSGSARSGVSARTPLDEEARRKLAHDVLRRRLQGATGRPLDPPRPVSPPPSEAPERDRQARLRDLASSLREAARVTGGVDRAERHHQEALAAEQRGDVVGAVNAMRLATTVAPDRPELQVDLDRFRHLLAAQLAETYEKQARYEEEQGSHLMAARSWMKVAEGRPESFTYPMFAAMALLRANEGLKQAKELAERAVELAPDSARPRAVLAEVFLRAGMLANAKRELQAAAKLDPEAEFVKNLQRELK